MPFPWKKNRVARISNFVADLQSPKRGGSLVVETGFPTSLIDLFVKNRSRFKKPKLNKRARPETPDPPPPSNSTDRMVGDDRKSKSKPKRRVHRENPDPAPPAPTTTPAPDQLNSNDRTALCAEARYAEAPSLRRLIGENRKAKPKKRVPREIPDPTPPPALAPELSYSNDQTVMCVEPRRPEPPILRRLARDGHDRVSGSDKDMDRFPGSGSDPNKAIAAILKTFLVLIVTLSVKKLTFGITMSAFLLLFIEYARNRVVSCLKPCSNANMAFKSFTSRVSSCVSFQNLVSGGLESETVHRKIVVEEVELRSGSSCIEEIEIEETKRETTYIAGSEMEEEQCEISERKTSKSTRSAKFKSRIVKKLVPRKLRGSKKEKGMKSASSVEEEIEEEEEEDQEESKLECIEDDEVEYGGTTCSIQIVEEQERFRLGNSNRGGNSESGCIMMFMIALAGLAVSPFLALILTVTWVLMMKMIKSSGRSLNVPVIMCSKQISS